MRFRLMLVVVFPKNSTNIVPLSQICKQITIFFSDFAKNQFKHLERLRLNSFKLILSAITFLIRFS